MKKMKVAVVMLTMLLCTVFTAQSATPATLKDGVITYSPGSHLEGQPIPLGVDLYGYNYNAHRFSGSYFNAYANGDGYPPYTGDDDTYVSENPTVVGHWAWQYRNDQIAMKWNDAWLSNEDSDGDGKLDRHLGFGSYIGSGAWITNHMSGDYEENGESHSWNYFIKIVAVPADAQKVLGVWYAADGSQIGADIWNEFATIQEIYNDSGSGDHGVLSKSPVGPGVGKY